VEKLDKEGYIEVFLPDFFKQDYSKLE